MVRPQLSALANPLLLRSLPETVERLCICFVNFVLCYFHFFICFYPLDYNRQISHLLGSLRRKTKSRPSQNQFFSNQLKKLYRQIANLETKVKQGDCMDDADIMARPQLSALALSYMNLLSTKCLNCSVVLLCVYWSQGDIDMSENENCHSHGPSFIASSSNDQRVFQVPGYY